MKNDQFRFLRFGKGILICEERRKWIQDIIGDVFCPKCSNEKCVYLSTNLTSGIYDCKECKACSPVLNVLFQGQKLTIMLFGYDGTLFLQEKRAKTTKKKKNLIYSEIFLRQSQSSTHKTEPEKTKLFPFMA